MVLTRKVFIPAFPTIASVILPPRLHYLQRRGSFSDFKDYSEFSDAGLFQAPAGHRFPRRTAVFKDLSSLFSTVYTRFSSTMASHSPVSRGAFIVVEGLDRSGKTTQVKRLEAELSKHGREVKSLRFPGKSPPTNACP